MSTNGAAKTEKWPPIEVEIADAIFLVRHIGQKRRDDIADSCTRKTAGSIVGELNVPRFQDAMSDELLAGWVEDDAERGVTPETAMRLGYEDFDALPVNDAGCVPFNAVNARKLYRFCLRDRFANELDTASRNMGEAMSRAKKRAADSSATSSAPTT